MDKGKVIVFGGGCFWCMEAVFGMIEGVKSVSVGYAGGNLPNPSYGDVLGGKTGHAEVVRLVYDPDVVSLKNLLDVFFLSHDPTTLNRQGNDVGEQYRSIILYTNDDQMREIGQFIEHLNIELRKEHLLVVTDVVPLADFYPAEDYHRSYYLKNKSAPYCRLAIEPKLEKIISKFSNIIKKNDHQ